MRPYTEAPPQDPSNDTARPLLQRLFSPTDHDRHEDPHHPGDGVDDPTAHPAPTEVWRDPGEQATFRPADQVAGQDGHTADGPAVDDERRDATAWHDEQPDGAVTDDGPNGDRRMDGQGDVGRDDELSTTHDDVEAAALDEPARHDPAVDATADESAASAQAAEPTGPDKPTDFKPGSAPAEAVTAIWTEHSAGDLRDRWREAQLRFVDDPHQAADDIRTLVNEAVETLTAALASHGEQLNAWPANDDTEQYRMIVQRYRTFFERLLTF
jgi:hypothetical protein